MTQPVANKPLWAIPILRQQAAPAEQVVLYPVQPSSQAGFPIEEPPSAAPERHSAELPVETSLGEGPEFWRQIADLRLEVAKRMTLAIQDNPTLDLATRKEIGRAKIEQVILDQDDIRADTGQEPWTAVERERIKQSLFDALFGLGRIQGLVDDEAVENVEITGCDHVFQIMADGSRRRRPPVAETDADLIADIQFIASRAAVEQAFTPAQPRLELSLDGGLRLAAAAWITPRPTITIRCHRLKDISIAELVDLGELDLVLADFLTAAVRARCSIVVSGAGQGSGKTTLVRALANEIDPWERIVTIENQAELFLSDFPDRHRRGVVEFLTREGSAERGADGHRIGEFTPADAIVASLRHNADRVIVGEVRGPEIVSMFQAMQMGQGSLSTIHADSAEAAIQRMITCAILDRDIDQRTAARLVGQHIDLVVFIGVDVDPATGQRTRYVTEIIEIGLGDGDQGLAVTKVFTPGTRGRAVPHARPTFMDRLDMDPGLFNYVDGLWPPEVVS